MKEPDRAIIEAWVDTHAAAQGITLDPRHRAGVVLHLAITSRLARLILARQPPAPSENAPVFRP